MMRLFPERDLDKSSAWLGLNLNTNLWSLVQNRCFRLSLNILLARTGFLSRELNYMVHLWKDNIVCSLKTCVSFQILWLWTLSIIRLDLVVSFKSLVKSLNSWIFFEFWKYSVSQRAFLSRKHFLLSESIRFKQCFCLKLCIFVHSTWVNQRLCSYQHEQWMLRNVGIWLFLLVFGLKQKCFERNSVVTAEQLLTGSFLKMLKVTAKFLFNIEQKRLARLSKPFWPPLKVRKGRAEDRSGFS